MKFLSLGGLDELGKNVYVLEIANRLIVINIGARFPNKNELGIDKIISDFKYLKNNHSKIDAIILTNGIEENIGGFPFVIDQLSGIKVYATELTTYSINSSIQKSQRWKLKNQNISFETLKTDKVYQINPNVKLEIFELQGNFPSNVGLFFETIQGNVLFLSDYILTSENIWNKKNPSIYSSLLNKKVNVLVSDAKNAEVEGYNTPKYKIFNQLDKIINTNKKNRYLVVNYENDLYYVQEIINICKKNNLTLSIYDNAYYNFLLKISASGYIDLNNVLIQNINSINKNTKSLVLISVGVKNLYSTINHISLGNDKSLKLSENNDFFIFVTANVPGYELSVVAAMNEIIRNNIEIKNISFKNVLDFHPCQEDIGTILSLTKPNYVIPINGMYSNFLAFKNIAKKFVNEKNIFLLKTGEFASISVEKHHATVLPHKITVDDVFVDGTGIGDVNELIIHERKQMSESGVIIVSFIINAEKMILTSNISIKFSGLYINDFINFKNEIVKITKNIFEKNKDTNLKSIKLMIKKSIFKYIRNTFGKEPIVLPIIIET